MEKLLPQNIEAECGVLGSILIDPEVIVDVADTLRPSDFYRDAHSIIYEVIIDLLDRHEPADFITVCDELARKGKLDKIGGASYITSLINQVPTSGNAVFYAGIVSRTATLRRMIHAAGQIATVAYNQDEDALEQAEKILFSIASARSGQDFSFARELIAECMDDLQALQQHQRTAIGVPTGFTSVDYLLGGLQNSDLIIVGARPGMGKSSYMLSIAYNVAIKLGLKVAIFSLEMSKKQLMQRLMSYDSHVDLYRIRNGAIQDEEWGQLVTALERLTTDTLAIDDTGAITLSALCNKARRLKMQRGLDLLIVDYLQLMRPSSSGKSQNREQDVAEISQGLKALAKELNIPIIALAQLSRVVENRQSKVPQLSDLRESGSIENDADVVQFIYRDDYYDPDSERKGFADIITAKQRNGPIGTSTLRWIACETRFDNFEVVEAYG